MNRPDTHTRTRTHTHMGEPRDARDTCMGSPYAYGTAHTRTGKYAYGTEHSYTIWQFLDFFGQDYQFPDEALC